MKRFMYVLAKDDEPIGNVDAKADGMTVSTCANVMLVKVDIAVAEQSIIGAVLKWANRWDCKVKFSDHAHVLTEEDGKVKVLMIKGR